MRAEILVFGRWILVSSIFGYFINSLDRIALGFSMSMAELGAYAVAAMIARVMLVAANAFRAIMSKRALYIWALAVVLMFMRTAPAIFMNAEPQVMQFVRANAVSGAMDLWALLCVGIAILLGAGSVANEITSKTIVMMLARPVRRWEVLLGKWIGITAFVVLSLAIGVVLDLVVANYFGVHVQRLATLTTGGHVCTTNVPTAVPVAPRKEGVPA